MMKYKLWTMLAFSTFIVGCTTVPTQTQEAEPVAKEQTAVDFCYSLIDGLNNGERGILSKHFNTAILRRNTLLGMPLQDDEKKMLQLVFQTAASTVINELQSSLVTTDTWYHIDADQDRRCIMHSAFDDGGIQIMEYSILKQNKEYKIIDWVDHTLYLRGSDVLRTALGDSFKYHRLAETDPSAKIAVTKLKAYSSAMKARQPEKVWQAYLELPKTLQADRFYVSRLLTLVDSNHALFKDAIEIFDDLTPQEDKGLVFVDYYLEDKRYDDILKLIDTLETNTAKDPVYDLLRATVYWTEGDHSQFYQAAIEALNAGPHYIDIYWTLFEYFLEQKLYQDATIALSILEETFGYQFSKAVFASDPDYADFANSAELKTWLRSR